ncbi:hypothetical protein HPB48_020273 [Haemaphysalis longicornis]|uniref:Uncharacterized protein n=1 Tax=Haemaphysalis longicornis TaxID=44386 RepID=A0A9J6FVV2_HAELO|nr:hypothetical protein HPB48_020273 [Haemaphysalis longicornis]
MTINDFVGDDETEATAELTDVKIAAEVTCELTSEAVDGEPGPSTTEDPAPLPTAGEDVAAVELLRRYFDGMEGSGLAFVDSLETMEQAVVRQAANSKKQSTLLQFFSPGNK